jgi:hypothetical protein
MKSTDEATLMEWLDLEADGVLAAEASTALHKGLASRPKLRLERRLIASLHALLGESRIDVRAGFAARVTAALPATSWEPHRAWRLPLALAGSLAAVACLLLAGTAAAGDSSLGTFAAVADFFQTATLAGAGMLGATWQGVTLAFDELLVTSRSGLIALIVGLLFLDLLFLRMLRRGPRAATVAVAREALRDGPDEAR